MKLPYNKLFCNIIVLFVCAVVWINDKKKITKNTFLPLLTYLILIPVELDVLAFNCHLRSLLTFIWYLCIVSVVIKKIKMSFNNHELLKAFENRNLGKFAELLEVYEADPNFFLQSKNRTIFELVLSTPNSSSFIRKCIDYGADFYVVK